MEPDKTSPLEVLAACFALSSTGGLAALLRSGRRLDWRIVASAMLYSGLTGLVIGLVWYNYFDGRQNIFFLLGVSGLAGLGGTTLIDLLLQVFTNGGVTIEIAPKGKKPKRRAADTADECDADDFE